MGIINLKSQTDLSGFYVVFNGSTNNEIDGNRGISHLSEHLKCKGYDHLRNTFSRYGLNHNAYTSDAEIVFWMTGLDKYVEKYRKLFLDSIFKRDIAKKDFEKEVKIVLQEYNNHFNDQTIAHQSNLYRKLWHNYGSIGNRQDLENLTINDYYKFLSLQFVKPSKIICVSKNYPLDEDFIQCVDKNYTNNIGAFSPTQQVTIENLTEFKDQSSVLCLSPIIKDDFAAVKVVCAMLGSGLMSPLYQEIREKKGLVYFVWCYLDRIDDNSGIINIASEMSNKNTKQVIDIINNILKNKEKYLTQERLEIVRDNFNILKQENDILRYSNVNKYIDPIEWNTEQVIDDMTLDNVYEIINKYFTIDWYISIDKEEFI